MNKRAVSLKYDLNEEVEFICLAGRFTSAVKILMIDDAENLLVFYIGLW